MHGSTYDPAQIPAPKRATPYVVDSGAYAEYPPGLVSNFPPAGDVWTNVVELSEMVSLQFRTKKGGPGQILACRSIQEMWQPVVPTGGGGSTTIGWFASAGDPVIISKNGGSISWSALVQLVPDLRLGVVAMTNVGAPINKDVPMSELVKIEHAILDTLIPVMASNPPVCKP
jgi:CubicO group peptidase (beta-lactamase class C family)